MKSGESNTLLEKAIHAINPIGWSQIESRDSFASDFAVLRELLERDPSLVHQTSATRGYTLLHYAAWGASAEMGQLLIDHGARVDARADGGATPLALACAYAQGDSALAKRLAEIQLAPSNLRTAVALGRDDLLSQFFGPTNQLLPNAGADRESWALSYGFPDRPLNERPDSILADALAFAARNGRIEFATQLLRLGANINAFDYLAPPIFWAALYNREEMILFLLDQGARLDLRDDEYQRSPADWAAYFNHESLANKLRDWGSE